VLKFNVVDDLRRIYVAPLPCRVVRLSGFCEFGSKHPDKKAKQDFSQARSLVDQARGLLPAGYLCKDNDEGVIFHTCWRPQTPDDLPVVGRSEFIRNLWYNCGHGHLGLTRAVGTSRLLAELITSDGKAGDIVLGIDCSKLQPSRFRDFSITKAFHLTILNWVYGRGSSF
jgi:glycine/D-amino acid oxidase-like deaminating enzyme